MANDRAGVVVVGVDGSPASVSALVVALREARAQGRRVEVVTAWSWHDPFDLEGGYVLGRASRRRALRAQSAVMARAHRLVGTHLPVSGVIVEGDPVDVLLHAAEGADLLVIGASEQDESAQDVFHAVRERCIRHAPCPVLVVPQAAHVNLADVYPRGVRHVGA